MPPNPTRVRTCLNAFDFTKLFVEELGWDRHLQRLDVTVDCQTFTLCAVAHKRGMVAFRFESPLPAKHYGFMEKELDFIINYHIKYHTRLPGALGRRRMDLGEGGSRHDSDG